MTTTVANVATRLLNQRTAISLKSVSVLYPGHCQALSDISLEISEGEFVFIVGASGAGKSTLLKLLTHEEVCTSGTVIVEGFTVSGMTHSQIPALRRRVGVVYQNFGLLPDRTVYENVAFAMRVTGAGRRDVVRRIPEVLELVGLQSRPDAFPGQLSGGEQQRVAIARALVNRPKLLLADEPTGNLDPETSLGIVDLLHDINATGATVLVATHDVAIVDKSERRVLEFADGVLVRDEACGRYGRVALETCEEQA